MRFLSKSAIVIKTESLFTPTSTCHHYPLALTCLEDLRLTRPKLSVSASSEGVFVGSSCRYELPLAPLPRLNCMLLSHPHLAVIVRSGSRGTCAYVLIKPPLDRGHT